LILQDFVDSALARLTRGEASLPCRTCWRTPKP